MKTAFSLAALAFAADARCNKIERSLDRWISAGETHISKVESRLDTRIPWHVGIFNSDDNNSSRVSDITDDEYETFMLDIVEMAISNGDFTTTDLWLNRTGDIGSCSSLASLLQDYQDVRDEARELQNLWDYLTADAADEGVVAPDLSAYLSCSNPVFSS